MKGLLLCALLVSAAAAEDERVETPVRIEPAVDVVPANHLKFYLHFQDPMERGNVFRYLRLVEIDEAGKEIAEVTEPFREVELWDETFTRMTLWFHPGRQKPGVNLNVEIGPILEEGKRYRLEVSQDWKTETGEKLQGGIAHRFAAGPVDEKQPDPSEWRMSRSKSSLGRAIETIWTGEILDPVSVRKRVKIFVNNEDVEYRVDGKALRFGHAKSGSSQVKIEIDPRVEDLAGNSVARPFNLDMEKNPDFDERTDLIALSFELSDLFP